MSTITLNSDYGYTQYRVQGLSAGTTIDATKATFHQNNYSYSGHTNVLTYPVLVENSPNVRLIGGTVLGETNQDMDWRPLYINSAAVHTKGAGGAYIANWTITQPWDGIRHTGGDGYLIEDVYIKNARDDAVEADDGNSGIIRDSLFEDVFSGISTGDGDFNSSGDLVHIDSVRMSMKKYLYEGEMTHGSPFKMAYTRDTGGVEYNPKMKFTNNVIAVTDPDHFGQGRLDHAWDLMTPDSSGNVLLNLSDTPFSSSYPLPPFGWTVLQGQAARDYWSKAKAAWLDARDGTADTTPAPTPTPTPVPIEPMPSDSSSIKGTSSSDKLKGTSSGETIDGLAGNDTLWGKGGADILKGGSGKDIFVFDTAPGTGNVATITDFNVADDTVYLDNAVFTKLGSGSMSSPKKISSGYFEINDRAGESNDFLLYNKNTGQLLYDADANKSGAPVEIAKLAAGLNLTSYDFYII